MKIFSIVAGVIVLCASVAALPVAAVAAPTVIKISMVQPENDIFVKTMKDTFKEIVETKTNHEYKVDIYSAGSLGNCDTVFQGIQMGTIHMGVDSASNIAQFIPELAVLDMPYMFPTLDSIGKALKSQTGREFTNLFVKKKVNELAVIPSTFRTIATTNPVNKLEDVENLKLRTTSSKSHMLCIKSLGMAPTPMPVTEMLTGIQQGVVKGLDPDLNFLIGAGFIDVAKNVFLSDHTPVCYVFYCSSAWIKKLPDGVKNIIMEASQAYEKKVLERNAEYASNVLKELESKYNAKLVIPSKEEKMRWIEKSKVAYDELSEKLKPYALGLKEAAYK